MANLTDSNEKSDNASFSLETVSLKLLLVILSIPENTLLIAVVTFFRLPRSLRCVIIIVIVIYRLIIIYSRVDRI